MTRRTFGALLVLNVVLLAALAVVTVPAPQAEAQFVAGRDYVMIAGEASGRRSQNAVYVLEQTSGRMIALFFNSANNRVEYVAARDLANDLNP